MRRLLILMLLAGLSVAGATPADRATNEAIPALRVELYPFRGVIPAALANGRQVYRFYAAVTDDKRKVLFAHAEALLQAGMTRQIQFVDESGGEIRGAVTIGDDGTAQYCVQYSREGAIVMESAASVFVPAGR